MREQLFKIDAFDIRMSIILFEDAFVLNGYYDKKQHLRLHQHLDCEIFFALNGRLTITTETEVSEYSSSAVILSPETSHCANYQGTHGYCMYFTFTQNFGAGGRWYSELCKQMQKGKLQCPIDENICFYLDRLAKCRQDGTLSELAEPLLKLLFVDLFSKMFPTVTASRSSLQGKKVKYTNTIDAYVFRYFREPIHLEELAAYLYLCPKQVSRVIKKEYGCSFPDLVNRVRLKEACILLRETDQDIAKLANEVGYEYPNYFYRCFRKEYGMTPAQYRSEHKQKKQRETKKDSYSS